MAGVDRNIDGVGNASRGGVRPHTGTPSEDRTGGWERAGWDRLPNHVELVIKALNDEHRRDFLTPVYLLDSKEPGNESPGSKAWNILDEGRSIGL